MIEGVPERGICVQEHNFRYQGAPGNDTTGMPLPVIDSGRGCSTETNAEYVGGPRQMTVFRGCCKVFSIT